MTSTLSALDDIKTHALMNRSARPTEPRAGQVVGFGLRTVIRKRQPRPVAKTEAAHFCATRPTILRLSRLTGDLTPPVRFPIVAIEVDGEHHPIRVVQRDPDRQ